MDEWMGDVHSPPFFLFPAPIVCLSIALIHKQTSMSPLFFWVNRLVVCHAVACCFLYLSVCVFVCLLIAPRLKGQTCSLVVPSRQETVCLSIGLDFPFLLASSFTFSLRASSFSKRLLLVEGS